MLLITIALGGALGAVLRYLISRGMHAVLGMHFPYGTLTVNVLGSLMMGVLTFYFLSRYSFGVNVRAFFLIGLLGAFTTFSSFSIETLNLFDSGATGAALLNIILNPGLCLVAVTVGAYVGRSLS